MSRLYQANRAAINRFDAACAGTGVDAGGFALAFSDFELPAPEVRVAAQGRAIAAIRTLCSEEAAEAAIEHGLGPEEFLEKVLSAAWTEGLLTGLLLR
jgi:hypothetical protein